MRIIEVSVGLSTIFLYCYFGKSASRSFEKMSDCLYEMDWHKLPNHLQKYIILIIQNGQKPIYYHGMGIVVLNLETFTKVSIMYNLEEKKIEILTENIN